MNYVFVIFPFAFYILFAFLDGPVMCVDTPTYISMSISREPFYPLFLYVNRFLFKDNYLFIVVIIQSLITAFATYSLCSYIKKEYKLSDNIAYVVYLIMFSVSLLCRFAAKKSSMYSNSILSEGIAIPLYLVFFRYVLEYLNTNKKSSIVIATFLSFILISTRKQMYVSLVVLVIVLLLKGILKRKYMSIINAILVVAIVFGSCKLLDYTYTKTVCGINATHTSDNRFLTTMIFYVAEEEDAVNIKDQEAKNLFINIYNSCEKRGFMSHSAEGGWYEKLMHFSNNYDNIQTKTMWPMLEEYVENVMNIEGNEKEVVVDSFNSIFIDSLLFALIGRIVKLFINNFIGGLIITVSAERKIFIIYSIIIYVLYIGLLIRNLIKNGFNKITMISLLTLISIFVNVAIVSIVIFNQTRYTIYNMPQFYISLFLMIIKEITSRNSSNNKLTD